VCVQVFDRTTNADALATVLYWCAAIIWASAGDGKQSTGRDMR
jgi:hypothetical protein